MVPAPSLIVRAFGADATSEYITFPIPAVPTVTPGQASLSLGFPPPTMLDPDSQGGVPPFGQDMNGILRMITAYCVWLQGGGGFYFDAAFVTANGGYEEGSVLRSATNKTRFWVSLIDDNEDDPDTVPTPAGWIPQGAAGAGYLSVSVPAGTSNDFTPVGWGAAVGVLDVDISAGDATVTGFAAGYDGQRVVVTPVNGGANTLTLAALTGSSAANQLRAAVSMSFPSNNSVQIQYSAGVGKWLVLP
jgi:hypothetical protein